MLPSVLILFLVLILVPLAAAQTDQTGVIEGQVTGPEGNPVADAVLMVAQADGSYPRTEVSGSGGRFRLPFLNPGFYQLTVTAEGYLNYSLKNIRVFATQITTVDLKLARTLEVKEEITVTARQPLIDTITTERSTVFSAQKADLLPVPRRATGLVEFVPGARENRIWGGSTVQANSYLFDGVSVNQPGFGGDFLLPNPDWIEEVQVKGLGAGAEYGNFQGGLVNIVTKSGSNTFRWNVRSNYESSSWNSSNLVPGEAGSELDRRWEVNADISGPILKDKLYYFLSLQQARTDTKIVDLVKWDEERELGFLPTQREREERKALLKLTWQASNTDILNLVYGYDGVYTDYRDLDSFMTPQASTKQESPSTFYNFNWQKTLGRNNSIELKINGYRGDDDRLSYGSRDLPGVEILGGNGERFRNTPYTRFRSPENTAYSFIWDSTWTAGNVTHRLKTGASYEMGKWREQRFRNGRLTWRPEVDDDIEFDPDDPATWGFISSDWGGDIDLDTANTNSALFIQDYMTINPRLGVNAGLRYGMWTGKIRPGFDSGPKFKALSASGLDPRFGLVYDFSGSSKVVGKLHWGRYHQSMFALLYDRARGGHVFRNLEYWDWGYPEDELPDIGRPYTDEEREELFDFYDEDPLGEEVGPVKNYRQPFVDQWVAGVEWAINQDWKAGLDYIRRDNRKMASLVDRRLDWNYTPYRQVEVRDRGGNFVTTLPTLFISNDDILYEGEAPGLSPADIAALGYDQQLEITNPGGAKRHLDQVQLTTQYRGRGWDLSASLVWSDLQGNFDSVSGYNDSEGGEGAGGFVRPNEQVNWYGRLPNFSRWVAKVTASADLPWGLRGGAYLRWESGDYWTPSFTIDRRNYRYYTAEGEQIWSGLLYGVNGQEIFLEGRGSRKYDSVLNLDLHLDRPFRFDTLTWVWAIDVFNLLNDDALLSRKTSLNNQFTDDPTTLFLAPRSRQAGRGIRLSTSLRW